MYVHGDNLEQKENGNGANKKYTDILSKQYLREIRKMYNKWKSANLVLIGPKKIAATDDMKIIEQRVSLFNEYKDFIDQAKYAEHFDSRSNLHSSALEEFIYYLFKDLVLDYSEHALIGKSHTFKDIFFRSNNYSEMITTPGVMIERKDHDFVIGSRINADFACEGMSNVNNGELVPSARSNCTTLPKQEYHLAGWLYRSATVLCQRCEPLFR